jgi:hypothetical protein
VPDAAPAHIRQQEEPTVSIPTGQEGRTRKPDAPADLPAEWKEVEVDNLNGRAFVHADGQMVNVVAVEVEGMAGLAVATAYKDRWPTRPEIDRAVAVFMKGCSDVQQVPVGQAAMAQSPYSVALLCRYAARVLDGKSFFEIFG